MRRTGRRAISVVAAYLGVILAVIFAGFLGSAVGIWASILWGLVVLAAVVLFFRRRRADPAPD